MDEEDKEFGIANSIENINNMVTASGYKISEDDNTCFGSDI